MGLSFTFLNHIPKLNYKSLNQLKMHKVLYVTNNENIDAILNYLSITLDYELHIEVHKENGYTKRWICSKTKLTEKDAQIIIKQTKLTNWINSHGISSDCPACGKNNWAAGQIISAPTMAGGGMQIGGPTVPMVQLICGACAYVMLYAAVPIGLAK